MPENDKVITVVHEWVIKAENDLKAASHILKLGEECPTDTGGVLILLDQAVFAHANS
jgi:hypothetical protein